MTSKITYWNVYHVLNELSQSNKCFSHLFKFTNFMIYLTSISWIDQNLYQKKISNTYATWSIIFRNHYIHIQFMIRQLWMLKKFFHIIMNAIIRCLLQCIEMSTRHLFFSKWKICFERWISLSFKFSINHINSLIWSNERIKRCESQWKKW